MCTKRVFSEKEDPRRTRSWLLRSFVLLIAFGSAAFLLLGGYFHFPRFSKLHFADKTPVSPPASRFSVSSGAAWQPPARIDVWNLVLVNPWNPLPENYEIQLTQLNGSQCVDWRCAAALQQMMDDCREAGLSPLICSSYRTQETQQGLYNAQVNDFLSQGYTQTQAEKMSATIVALPGTSEHQLGLAVDIVDSDYQILVSSQEDTPVQRWLMEHCWEYGFILRYPKEKSDLTGIIYEPWHYRYVGKAAAEEITRAGICLEEYLGAVPFQTLDTE